MVIDGVLLCVLRSLCYALAQFSLYHRSIMKGASFSTFASIHILNCCSKPEQACADCPELAQQPNTEDMTPKQGFSSGLFGRLTLRCGSGGNRPAPILFAAPLPGGLRTILTAVRRIRDAGGIKEDELRW